MFLFGLLNFFVPADKSIRELPTSRGVMLMLIWRCVEAALVLIILTPLSDHLDEVESPDRDPTDNLAEINAKAFNMKALVSLCLAITSFACFFTAGQYEKQKVRPDQRAPLPTTNSWHHCLLSACQDSFDHSDCGVHCAVCVQAERVKQENSVIKPRDSCKSAPYFAFANVSGLPLVDQVSPGVGAVDRTAYTLCVRRLCWSP